MGTFPVAYDPDIIARFRKLDNEAPQDDEAIIYEIISVYADRVLYGNEALPTVLPTVRGERRVLLDLPAVLNKQLLACVSKLGRPRIDIVRAALVTASATIRGRQTPIDRPDETIPPPE